MSVYESNRESFEDFGRTHGYNPAFLKRIQEKRREEEASIIPKVAVTPDTPIDLTPRQKRLALIAELEREKILAAKAEKERLRQLAISRIKGLVDRMEGGEDVRIPAKDIIKAVAAVNHVKFEDITGPRRYVQLVKIRHEAIRQVADLRPDLSLPALGRIFNRDHTSILHALRKTAADPDNYRKLGIFSEPMGDSI